MDDEGELNKSRQSNRLDNDDDDDDDMAAIMANSLVMIL